MRTSIPRSPASCLDRLEPRLKLRVRLVERERRMHAGLPAQIHDRKQQIAQLRLEPRMARIARRHAVRVEFRAIRADLGLDLRQLLPHLLDRSAHIRPVEPDAGGAFLQPVRAVQGGKPLRQPLRERAPRASTSSAPTARVLPSAVRRLPSAAYSQGCRRVILSTSDPATAPTSNAPRSSAMIAWKSTCSRTSPSSLSHRRVVARTDRVVELVHLLVEVRPQRVVRLRAVPRIARAQVAHDRERVVERGARSLPASG